MIDIEEMRGKLLTVEQTKERLAGTEGLAQYEFATDGSNRVTFDFPDTWNVGLKEQDGLFVTGATVDLDGTTFQLTKDAALEAVSKGAGIQKSHALTTPGSLITPDVNWHYSHGGNGHKGLKLLAGERGAVALTRDTVTPFSNVRLLDAAIEAVQTKYETDDILVDYKLFNELDRTNMRLIVPSTSRNIGSARSDGAGGGDPWSVGLDITNSIIGAHSLEISGYLFAWVCTNGMTSTHASSGKFRRKPTETPATAYEWAENVVEEVLGGLEHEFEAIESLTRIPLEGELNETLATLFERFKIPINLREAVIAKLVESDDLSAYGLLAAITAAANNGDLSAAAVRALLNAGGQVAHVLANRCDTCGNF